MSTKKCTRCLGVFRAAHHARWHLMRTSLYSLLNSNIQNNLFLKLLIRLVARLHHWVRLDEDFKTGSHVIMFRCFFFLSYQLVEYGTMVVRLTSKSCHDNCVFFYKENILIAIRYQLHSTFAKTITVVDSRDIKYATQQVKYIVSNFIKFDFHQKLYATYFSQEVVGNKRIIKCK